MRRIVVVGILLAAVAALQGCSYAKYRATDLAQLFDMGLTFSKKPQFSAYLNCPTVVPIGYGKVDGYFLGLNGGRGGFSTHKREEEGLLFWGHEKSSYGAFDKSQSETLNVRDVGVVGLAQTENKKSAAKPVCIHHLHLGWVGFVWNINWLEFPDFFAGVVGLDPMRDDGPDGGLWFRKKEPAVEEDVIVETEPVSNPAATVAARREIRGEIQ